LSGLQRVTAIEQILGRRAFHQDGCGLFVADEIGNLDHAPGGRHDPVISISAGRPAGIGYAVALFEFRDTAADLLDHPRRLHPEAARHGQRILPAPVVDVHEIKTDRGLPHQDFAQPRRAELDCFKTHDVGISLSSAANYIGLHLPPPFLLSVSAAPRTVRAWRPSVSRPSGMLRTISAGTRGYFH